MTCDDAVFEWDFEVNDDFELCRNDPCVLHWDYMGEYWWYSYVVLPNG